MTNLVKLGYSENDNADEIAVGMLLGRIKDDIERERFDMEFSQYEGLYKAMKEWLLSEVEE